MITVRRIGASVATALFALTAIVASAGPADAHTVSGQGATNFVTRFHSVTPALPGLTIKVVELGSRLSLTWTGAGELIVEGYENEPYLRLGPDGVFRNRLSPATYLNVTKSTVSIPANVTVDPKATPIWDKISSGHTALWHDHRIHFMGTRPPPEVRRAPGSPHSFPWTMPLMMGGQTYTVAGSYDWVPAHSALPWVALVLVLFVVGAAVGLTRRWWQGLLALTLVIIAADALHTVGIGLFAAGSVTHQIVLMIGGGYYSVIAWILGAIGVVMLARRSLDGLFAIVFCGLVIGVFGGLTDVGWLSHSEAPFRFGASVARPLVAISIGGAAGVVAGSIIAFRRNRAPV